MLKYTLDGVTQIMHVLLEGGANVMGKLGANAGVIIGAVELAANQVVQLAAGTNLIGSLAPPSAGFSGQFTVTTAGTSVQLNGGTSQAIRDGVEVVCDTLSAGHLLVRWATGTGAGNGRRVYPGMACFVAIDNINKVWCDASASGSTGSWSAS